MKRQQNENEFVFISSAAFPFLWESFPQTPRGACGKLSRAGHNLSADYRQRLLARRVVDGIENMSSAVNHPAGIYLSSNYSKR